MTAVPKSSFTRAEAAEIFGKSVSTFKIWQHRGICSLGKPGKVWTYSWLDMIKIGGAIALNGYGISMQRAFRLVDHRLLHTLFSARLVGQDFQELFLFYAFDPLDAGEYRTWTVMGLANDAFGNFDPQNYDTPTEAHLKVNMLILADRWVRTITNYVNKSEGDCHD